MADNDNHEPRITTFTISGIGTVTDDKNDLAEWTRTTVEDSEAWSSVVIRSVIRYQDPSKKDIEHQFTIHERELVAIVAALTAAARRRGVT